MQCVVIGGGIAGLATAHRLLARGVEPLLLERDGRVGGKIRSARLDGFLCEAGPTALMDREPAVRGLLDELGLAARAQPLEPAAARKYVLADGTLLPVPMGPLAFARSPVLSALGKLRLLGELLVPRGLAAEGGDESVAAFARRRLGTAAALRLIGPLVSGIFAGDPEELSVASALPWLARAEREHGSLLRGAAKGVANSRRRGGGAAGGGAAARGAAGRLLGFPEGMEELPRALAARLGARVRRGVTVRRIEPCLGQYRLSIVEHGRTNELLAPAVVVALPGHAAAPLVGPLATEAAAALAAIPYAPVAVAHLGWDQTALTRRLDGYGFLGGEGTSLLGALFGSAALAGAAPPGTALLSVRVGGMRRPELAGLDDGALTALVLGELVPLLGARGAPRLVEIDRHERALPQYTVGHRWRVAAVRAAERRHPGLFFTGSAFEGVGVADCIRAANAVAERVVAGWVAGRGWMSTGLGTQCATATGS